MIRLNTKNYLNFLCFLMLTVFINVLLLLRITMTMTMLIKETIKLVHAYIQRFSSLLSWWHISRHSAGEIVESYTTRLAGSKKRGTLDLAWTFKIPKHIHSDTLLLKRPSKPPNPYHVVPLSNDQAFKSMSLWGSIIQTTHFTPCSPLDCSHIRIQKCIQSNFKSV